MRNWREVLVVLCLACSVQIASAQLLTTLFPEGVPGYGAEPGVTVTSRARPAFDPLGIRLDTLLIRPLLGLSLGYDSNVFAGQSPRGAWQVATQPSVLVAKESSVGSFGAYVSANDVHYPTIPSQNRTDWSAFLGSTFNIDRDRLTIGAGYLASHEDRTALDALPSDRPVAFSVINMRAAYDAALGRATVTPSIEFNRWRFGDTTIFGAPLSEATRDRTTAQLGLTLRYNWMSGRDLLLVTRVLDTHYDQPAPGVVSNNSLFWQGLFGVDYDDDTVWRYRLLAGLGYRQPSAASIASRTTGIAEAEITWLPSGMTTVRATASRGIEDAAQTGLSSYTYTSARLAVDHEYLRDVLLNAATTFRQATFDQTGGQQFGIAFDVGATWLINRNLRLSMTYDFTDVRNSHLPAGTVAGNYARSLTLLSVRIGL